MIDDTFKINYKTLPIAVSFETPLHTNSHNHAEFEILLFCGGKADVSVGRKRYRVKKGDMIFVNPFEVHSLNFDENTENFSRLCICFDCGILIDKGISEKIVNKDILVNNFISDSDAKYLKKEFLNVIEAYRENSVTSDTEIIAHLSLIFAEIIKKLYFSENENTSENNEFCAEVLNYIKREYGSNITSKDAAYALSYNHSYFCRIFKKNFKKTFSQYLTMYRIANSKFLLEEKKLSIAEIAGKSGFSSYSYFSRCFKKYFGILPSEYIENIINM